LSITRRTETGNKNPPPHVGGYKIGSSPIVQIIPLENTSRPFIFGIVGYKITRLPTLLLLCCLPVADSTVQMQDIGMPKQECAQNGGRHQGF
jgi:hypothetical protein